MTRGAALVVTAGLAAVAVWAEDAVLDLTPDWDYVADTVMGGVSQGQLTQEVVAGRRAARLTGQVSLENEGGFVQMAFDLSPDGGAMDASSWDGIEMEIFGNGETYELRLRTARLTRPWQSFRAPFAAPAEWTAIRVPFAALEAHRTEAVFDPAELRRIGVVAIGREFAADVAVSGIRFYAE